MNFNIEKENNINNDTSELNIQKKDQNISLIDGIKPDLTKNINSYPKKNKYKIKLKPNLTHVKKTSGLEELNLLSNPKKNNDNSDKSETNSSIDFDENSIDLDDESSIKDFKSNINNSKFEFNKSSNNDDTVDEEDEEEDEEDDEDDDGEEDENEDEYEYVEEDENDEDEDYEYEKSYEEIQQEKQDLLFKIDRLEKAGYKSSRKYTMASNLDDLKFEYKKIKRQRDVEKSIRFSRKILMAIVSGIELLNGKFDPFDIKLNGWSENMMDSINDYDEVFEELHDKYSESVSVSPELKLIMMVAGSGFMFHLQNSLFKSATPSLNDILKQNPDIMKNISEAAAESMSNNLGPKDDPIANMMRQGVNMKMNNNKEKNNNSNETIDDIVNELNNNSNNYDIDNNIKRHNINIKKKNNENKSGGITLDL